jgi:hypothetical protein
VTLRVRLARWRRQNRRCERKTFADRLPQGTRPFARRTCRVDELARLVGRAAGGRPAERLLTHLGLPQSDDTVLRNLKRHVAECREDTATRVVGIDDWAWQKGCRYGTIMVDLERRQFADLLSDPQRRRQIEVQTRIDSRHPQISRDVKALSRRADRLFACADGLLGLSAGHDHARHQHPSNYGHTGSSDQQSPASTTKELALILGDAVCHLLQDLVDRKARGLLSRRILLEGG